MDQREVRIKERKIAADGKRGKICVLVTIPH